MQSNNQEARKSLVALIEYVFENRQGFIRGISYEALAARIGRVNKHGIGHGRGMGRVLSEMGRMLFKAATEWKEEIPQLSSLVVSKSGPNAGLPDIGICEFWPEYLKMSPAEKFSRVQVEYERILNFGSRWNDILTQLELPVPPRLKLEASSVSKKEYWGRESTEHLRLKCFISSHPEMVGAPPNSESFEEYPLPSNDQIDVLFKAPHVWIAVEVKSSVSDRYPNDYERGLYQTIKYGAILKAMSKSGKYSVPSNVESILVLESSLPHHLRQATINLGIRVIENIKNQM